MRLTSKAFTLYFDQYGAFDGRKMGWKYFKNRFTTLCSTADEATRIAWDAIFLSTYTDLELGKQGI